MPKYLVTVTKTYELEIERPSEDEAIEDAMELPLTFWRDDYEMDCTIEKIEKEMGA